MSDKVKERIEQLEEALEEVATAMEAIRGIEAFIYDGKMKTVFQKRIYPAIEKARAQLKHKHL